MIQRMTASLFLPHSLFSQYVLLPALLGKLLSMLEPYSLKMRKGCNGHSIGWAGWQTEQKVRWSLRVLEERGIRLQYEERMWHGGWLRSAMSMTRMVKKSSSLEKCPCSAL